MWKVENQSKIRAFMSAPEKVLKGGVISNDKKHMYINPETVAEVTNEYGEQLATYPEIRVLSNPKKTKE